MPVFPYQNKHIPDPIYKAIAECYLRAWFLNGAEISRVAERMQVSRSVVRKLVDNLQKVYAQLPGAHFPTFHMLNKFGLAMGYKTHIYLEKSES